MEYANTGSYNLKNCKMKKAWKSKLFMIVCLMSLFTLTNTVELKAQTTFDTAICWSATKQINFPVYHITANPNDRKLFFYNTLNAHQTGIFVCDMDNDNDPTVFIGLQSPVGEVVHNPFTNQMLISQNSEAIPARVKVLNNSLVFENDIELSGVSHATNMYIAENGLLYIAANMYDNTPKIFVLDAQTYQPVSGSPFEVSGLIPASGYYDIFSADFCYNPYNQKVYATFTTNNTTVPSDIESYNSLDPYFSALNSSLLSASPTTTFPGILVEISEEGISTLLSNLNGPRELLCVTPTNTNGSNQGFLYLNAADLIRYDCQTGNTLYFAGLDLNDITYNSNQNCLYGFRDTFVGEGNPLDEHPSHRLTEVYRVQDGQGTSTLLYTYDGQSASLVSNPYDGMLYLQTKVDAGRLGAQPMQVIPLQPDQVNQEPPPVSLHHRGFCPELDINLDFHYANYNLTTPYIDPYTNRMYLPNGGHSSVSVVEFEPNELLLLNNDGYDWISIPRLLQQGAGPNINSVLSGNIFPDDYILNSELQNCPPGGSYYYSSFYTGSSWPTPANMGGIYSERGYKLDLKYNYTEPQNKFIEMQGTVVDPSTPMPLYMGKENWVGYFLYQEQDAFDALESIVDNLTLIKHEKWTCVYAEVFHEDPGPQPIDMKWYCSEIAHNVAYGDMLVLKTSVAGTFNWYLNGQPAGTTVKQEPEYFSYMEQPDYTPVVVELDSADHPLELGVFVGDNCVGACTVSEQESELTLMAYLDGASGEDISFEKYYGTKSNQKIKVSEYFVYNKNVQRHEKRTIKLGEGRDYYQVSFREKHQNDELVDDQNIGLKLFPNPAQNELFIQYALREPTPVSITVHDIFGKLVARVSNRNESQGEQILKWNLFGLQGNRLPGGIYMVRIKAGAQTMNEKLVIQ
jgi:hypothetical protein